MSLNNVKNVPLDIDTDHLTFVSRVTTQTVERHVLRSVHKHHREDSVRGPGHRGHVEISPGENVEIKVH